MKRIICTLVCLALLFSLAGCAKKNDEPATDDNPQTQNEPAAEPTPVEDPSEAPVIEPVPEDETGSMPDIFNEPAADSDEFVNGGLKLSVPSKYSSLVQVGMGSPLFGKDNLFSVREIASMEAGEKTHPGEDWGEGALFGIGRLTEDEVHEMMCGYFNNERIFARDADRNYYVIFQPSDVRFYRENMENIADSPDMELWSEMNDWAREVPEKFIELNGLEAWSFGGSTTETMLSRVAYRTDTLFVLNSLDYGELYPAAPEPSASFAAQLLENVDFEYCDDSVEAPDGEYYVIDFPNDMMSVHVFKGGDYIREDYDGFEMLLKVTGPKEGYFADVMEQWNQALAQAGG